jgi:hypothetical protein
MTTRLLLQLLLAASDLTGYPVPEVMPHVAIVAPEVMPCACKGAYEGGTLWVSGDLDLAKPFARSVLLHELVHHLQEQAAGAPQGQVTRVRFEREAVEAQNRYLALQGSGQRAAVAVRDE